MLPMRSPSRSATRTTAGARAPRLPAAVRAAGQKIAFDRSIGQALEGSLPLNELSGRTAPAHMIRLIAEEAGGGVQYALGDDSLVMGAVLPDA